MVEIFEDKLWQDGSTVPWADLMTDEQRKRGHYYATEYLIRRGEVQTNAFEWNDIQKLYACEREPNDSDPDAPNSFIPLITPVIEGQVASMMESTIDFNHVTDNPAHEKFMPQLNEASAWFRRKNLFNLHMKDFSRIYDLLGNCWVTINWENSHSNKPGQPNGYPRISVPPLQSVLVDGKIKDYKDLQNAEYIMHEIGFQSVAWARKEYGDEMANAIVLNLNRYDGLNPQISYDDKQSWMLIHVWTRNNEYGNLQLIEMDTAGLILRESDPKQPYYKHVDNEYPFAFARMIPKQGNFYGYGDGRILKHMQETVNNLTDELELAARFSAQSKLVVDPSARMELDQLNSDPSKVIIANNPNQTIRQLQYQGVNAIVVNMIEFLLREAQRATRFSDVMTGQSIGSSATATSVNAQMQQGSVGIKDKKTDIAEVMQFVDMYSIKLCMQYWTKPFWAMVAGEKASFIDMPAMLKAPASVPASSSTIMGMFKKRKTGERINAPEFELLTEGNDIKTVDLSFSTRVVIGQSMARGKTDMFNLLLALMQMQVVGDDGQPKPMISADRAKKLMEEAIGFRLETDGESQNRVVTPNLNPIGQGGAIQQPMGQPVSMPPDNLASTVPGIGGMDKRGMM